jgi:hypothetical protein
MQVLYLYSYTVYERKCAKENWGGGVWQMDDMVIFAKLNLLRTQQLSGSGYNSSHICLQQVIQDHNRVIDRIHLVVLGKTSLLLSSS